MRLTEVIETSAGPVNVRELTVGEVRAWLAGLELQAAKPVDVVDDALFEGFSLADLPLFTESVYDVDSLSQSDIRNIHEAAKRINPDFFALRGKLLMVGRALPKGEAEAPAES